MLLLYFTPSTSVEHPYGTEPPRSSPLAHLAVPRRNEIAELRENQSVSVGFKRDCCVCLAFALCLARPLIGRKATHPTHPRTQHSPAWARAHWPSLTKPGWRRSAALCRGRVGQVLVDR